MKDGVVEMRYTLGRLLGRRWMLWGDKNIMWGGDVGCGRMEAVWTKDSRKIGCCGEMSAGEKKDEGCCGVMEGAVES